MNAPHVALEYNKHESREILPYRRMIFDYLKQCRYGGLILIEGTQHHAFGDVDGDCVTSMVIHHPSAYRAFFWRGSLGASEAYVDGLWTSNNLSACLRFFIKNMDVVIGLEQRQNWFMRPLAKASQWWTKNTKVGSLKNIQAHYDLSNEFFFKFLDKSRNYSSGIYETPESSLEEAQELKMKTICDKLDLGPDDHVLEIGTGWGGMSIYMASNYGCKVTTTTISEEQYQHAKTRVRLLGLEKLVKVMKKDYRDLVGSYDKVLSIEMIEAVGKEYLEDYFKNIERLLKPGGRVLIQGIAMHDHNYEMYCDSMDFIRKYVFPGSHLISLGHIKSLLSEHTKLRWEESQDYALDYAQTLRDWSDRFNKKLDSIKALGFDQKFIRMWNYYLSYCEAGFEEQYIAVYQFTMDLPES